jgi:ferredoxin--NADP+ reductase
MTSDEKAARVAIVGAGPAGLFAAKELAEKGINVALFNRDIKPGGLAEYGIYPEKTRLKEGLRNQFHEILNAPGIFYFGNTFIGEKFPVDLVDLKKLGFSAILVAAGAQGTKWLGLDGEDSQGVFHAKELVYHYNHLPPYGSREFAIGKKVIIVGVGNVMTDIVRYLVSLPQVEMITTIARRGLAEVKFDKKELEPIISLLDWADFQSEVERISPLMHAIDQSPDEYGAMITEVYTSVTEKQIRPKWRLHFLYSPVKIISSESRVSAVQLEENALESSPAGIRAKGTAKSVLLPADTVIFSIGDQIDRDLGLPMKEHTFALSKHPCFPVNGTSFELQAGTNSAVNLEGIFVCGWSRNASAGMVGMARKDGVNAARAIQVYLSDHGGTETVMIDQLQASLTRAGYVYVTTEALLKLETAEKDQARNLNLVEYKFDSNEEMLRIMDLLG